VSFSVCEDYAAENVTETTATPPESDAPLSNTTGPMGHGRTLIVFPCIAIPGFPNMCYRIVISFFLMLCLLF